MIFETHPNSLHSHVLNSTLLLYDHIKYMNHRVYIATWKKCFIFMITMVKSLALDATYQNYFRSHNTPEVRRENTTK